MMSLVPVKLRRLGVKQLIALAGSGILAVAAGVLAFTPRPALSAVPIAVLLLHLILQVVLLQYRMVLGLRDLGRLRAGLTAQGATAPGRPAPPPSANASVDRLEYLQKRILAALETERFEAAERHRVLLSSRKD